MTRPDFCDDHGLTKPCRGCEADKKAARGEAARALLDQGVPRSQVARMLDRQGGERDVRSAAAGDTDDDD